MLASCGTKTPLTQEQTVAVMVDAMRLEASQQVAYNYLLLSDSIWQKQYQFVLKKHGISEQDFEATLLYYKQHGKEFADLMDKVVSILDAESKQDFVR